MMSFLIERAGSHIAPHCQTLIHYLPMLWQESEGHHLLRCAIVTTLANLVQVGESLPRVYLCYSEGKIYLGCLFPWRRIILIYLQ